MAIRGSTRAVIALAALAAPSQAVAQQPAPSAEPALELAFEANVTLGPSIPVGLTPLGTRNIVPITGGTFAGPDIKGTIIPGGWDWQLIRADGSMTIKADYMLRTDDGTVINIVNIGTGRFGPDAQPLRTNPVFEAPIGKHDWLNTTAFIGTLDIAGTPEIPAVRIRVYRAR